MTPQKAAGMAAEAIRALNHTVRPGAAELDVTDVYDLLAELALQQTLTWAAPPSH